MNNKKIRVFLSRPNPFTKEQQYFIEKLKSTLDKYNIESITLQAKDYSPYESLTVLNEMIKRCYGMVILAFGHTYIQSGILKKGAVENKNFFEAEEQSLDGKWITSSFCQIEGAMAISNNIPILIIKQKNLRIDGILKDDQKIVSVSDFTLENTSQIDFFFEKILEKEIYCWKKSLEKIFNKIEGKIV